MKKVAILGYTPTRAYAPYDDDRWEIWGLNDLYRFKGDGDVKRWTRWFNMHQDRPSAAGRTAYAKNLKEYAKWDIPVYLQEKHPLVPCSVTYPLDEIVNKYGDYFTNSISYMIALAIHEGFDDIGVYGVDMATDTEYDHQRPSCEYWLGVARGAGINVYIHPAADLLKKRYLYGYEDHKEEQFTNKINSMIKHMQSQYSNAEIQTENAKKVKWQCDGAISSLNALKKSWRGMN